MINFHETYRPLTSRPFLSNHTYMEHLPCMCLRPYISCYWSTKRKADRGMGENFPVCADEKPVKNSQVLVIPDTCMDVIIRFNYTRQSISGYLCSMQDAPFFSASGETTDDVSVFAIRFYFWSAHLFLKIDFKDIQNQNLDLYDMGSEWSMLFEPFFYLESVDDRISLVERFLIRKLNEGQENANLFNSFYKLISAGGRMSVKEACEYSCISQRQMERQFLQTVGLPMKRISNLVRYQNVWREMIFSAQFDIHDAVYRYGYTDQSHLLREFKRFHGTTPEEARRIADKNR